MAFDLSAGLRVVWAGVNDLGASGFDQPGEAGSAAADGKSLTEGQAVVGQQDRWWAVIGQRLLEGCAGQRPVLNRSGLAGDQCAGVIIQDLGDDRGKAHDLADIGGIDLVAVPRTGITEPAIGTLGTFRRRRSHQACVHEDPVDRRTRGYHPSLIGPALFFAEPLKASLYHLGTDVTPSALGQLMTLGDDLLTHPCRSGSRGGFRAAGALGP